MAAGESSPPDDVVAGMAGAALGDSAYYNLPGSIQNRLTFREIPSVSAAVLQSVLEQIPQLSPVDQRFVALSSFVARLTAAIESKMGVR